MEDEDSDEDALWGVPGLESCLPPLPSCRCACDDAVAGIRVRSVGDPMDGCADWGPVTQAETRASFLTGC